MPTAVEAPPATAFRDSRSPVLVAIADTFVGGMGNPGSSIRVAASMDDVLGRLPSKADRRQLRMIVALLGTGVGSFLLTGRPSPLHHWPRERRIALMASWSTSRLPFRRQLFQVFKRLSLLSFLGETESDGTNPIWREIGYPGPIAAAPQTPKSIRTILLDGDTTLTCDAVVVGSGAGGGVVSAELAAAGKEVLVLEEGGYYNEADFDQLELSMLRKLYYQGGLAATSDAGVALIAGACLGGGTVVNYTTSFRSPDWLRQEWANLGLDHFLSDEYTASLDAVYERLGVNLDQSRISARERVLERGLRRLDWHLDSMPRNVQGCTQDARCGYCGYGCQLGAKQSTLKTYLLDAYRRDARFVVNCRVDRVLIEGGRAVGVRATVRQPAMPAFTLLVRSKAVIACAGSIGTPALLMKSGVRAPAVGRYLRLHPATAVSGIFDESIRPWEGTLQALYSDQFIDLDGQHYGPKIESAPLHPALLAQVTPWRRPDQYGRLMRALPNMSLAGILLRDSGSGRVTVKDGTARVHYRLSRNDTAHMRKGIEAGARILEAAGAKEVYTSQSEYVSYRPGQRGGIDAFMAEVDRHGYGSGQMAYVSFHQMGSCRMGIDPATSVIGADHQAHAVKGLFVADGSAFPSASGVNPMITIMAMAQRASRYIAAQC
jgi:long-chain-alcohol oxidase